MTTIHAEIAADQQSLFLLAGGLADPEDMALQAKRLKALTPLFSKSDPPGALTAPLTWPCVVQLSATFGPAFVPGPRLSAWITNQVKRRQLAGTTPRLLTHVVPDGFTPYPWQIAGADIISTLGSALITDEPGTGKTATTILGLMERAQGVFPVLVVCPASVVDSWVNEWRTWAPEVRAIAWRGSPKVRDTLLGVADVYVTSYETARVDAPPASSGAGKKLSPLLNLGAVSVVIDECHLIKNPLAARSQAVRRLSKKASNVVALSGTPITHHPGNLWPTLDAMVPGAWPSGGRWTHRYCETIPGDYKDEVLGLNRATEQEFRLTLLGQHRRVAKADVLADLPPKVYSVRTVDMPAKWRKVYDDFEARMLAELPAGPDGQTQELKIMDVLSKLTHLSALACSAADVRYETGPDVDEFGQPKEHVHLDLKAPSWKVDALLEVLDERPGTAVGAFAPSRQLMMLAGQAATEAGYRVGYVVGGQSMTERTANVEAFQAGNLDLICATTGAGGVGITLTAGSTCVFLQRPWSLVDSIQAEDRFHRIGSERHESIEIIDIVARNTIDTRVRAVLRERAGQLSELVGDPRIVADLLGGSSVTTERKKAS